jgi:transcriptional regulator with XRE-family HTH domain
MGKFPVFGEGELAREIAVRGLSQRQFADAVGVDEKTVSRAVLGRAIRPKSFGKILIGLAKVPQLEGAELVKAS